MVTHDIGELGHVLELEHGLELFECCGVAGKEARHQPSSIIEVVQTVQVSLSLLDPGNLGA